MDLQMVGASESKTVLFYRNFRGFTGGHLKVWHYFNHVRASKSFVPHIYFSKSFWRQKNNPWRNSGEEIFRTWNPHAADVLFVGGNDWRALPPEFRNSPPVPVINIVQGLSHADPANERYEFLKYRAIRICVNPKIEEALRAITRVNGPVFHIPMGMDHLSLPRSRRNKSDVVIAALKAPKMGQEIGLKLRRHNRIVEVLRKPLPRAAYLQKIADSRVAVFLPLRTEGFYLPPLEAMALRRIVVCPDCAGNRVYCHAGSNCLWPDYTAEAITHAVESALALSENESREMSDNAAKTAADYTLERERAAFLKILSTLDTIWNN